MSQVDTVIYVWSPRMALSVLHANEVADQAHLLGLRFLPLVDGRVPEDEWQSALTADLILTATMPGRHSALQSSQSLCSNRLLALDAYQHFPSVFMVRSDQLQAEKWTGAMSSRNWFEAFNADLKSLYRPAMPMLVSQNSDDANTPIKLLTRTSIAFEVDILQRGESCVPPHEFIVLSPEMAGLGDDKAVALGAYERVSPDGRFVLRSFSGKQLSSVSLMELPAPSFEQNSGDSVVAGITQTPLSNEAFPVQGSWRYVVDTDGQHFTFSDLLSKQKNAKPKFQGGMSGFYAAAAEVGSTYPAHSFDAVQIRSLSWPNASNDSDTSGEGMLTSRTITVNTGSHRIQADSGRVNLCLGSFASAACRQRFNNADFRFWFRWQTMPAPAAIYVTYWQGNFRIWPQQSNRVGRFKASRFGLRAPRSGVVVRLTNFQSHESCAVARTACYAIKKI